MVESHYFVSLFNL